MKRWLPVLGLLGLLSLAAAAAAHPEPGAYIVVLKDGQDLAPAVQRATTAGRTRVGLIA
jgi:hypothetical protein